MLDTPGQDNITCASSHLRLINRLADGLLALHADGPYAAERRLLTWLLAGEPSARPPKGMSGRRRR
jgi:hypothetical protein